MQMIMTSRLIESLESRDLKTVTYSSGSTLTDPSGTYFGAVLFGDNGNTQGTPTVASGVGDQTSSVAYVQWDPNVWDGIDSGSSQVAFNLNTDSTHAGTFSVGSSNTGGFSFDTSNQVHSVTIRGAVTGPGLAFDWSNIQISFYSGGSVVETVGVNALHADTMDSNGWDPAEAVAAITPTASNVDGVSVTANARLRAADGSYPGWTDISGQIFVS